MIPANIPINRIPKLKSFRRRVYIYIYRGSGLSPFAFLINLRNIKRLKLNCVCETKDGGVRICLSPEAHYSIISTNWISSFWITLSKSYLLPSREFQSRRKKLARRSDPFRRLRRFRITFFLSSSLSPPPHFCADQTQRHSDLGMVT